MDRRTYLRAVGASLSLVAGCARNDGGPKRVDMTDDLRFVPARVRVRAGGTVEWKTVGTVAHTVTAYGDRLPAGADYWASGGFDTEAAARTNLESGLVGADETYAHTFETAGEHPYFCVPHEGSGMAGVVAVG